MSQVERNLSKQLATHWTELKEQRKLLEELKAQDNGSSEEGTDVPEDGEADETLNETGETEKEDKGDGEDIVMQE